VRLDDEIGERFAILGLGVDPASLLDAPARDAADALGARLLHVADAGELRDADGGLGDWARRHGDARVIAVRPDRQVYGVYAEDGEPLGPRVSRALRDLRRALQENPR